MDSFRRSALESIERRLWNPEWVEHDEQAERGPSGSLARKNRVTRKLKKLQRPRDRGQDANEVPRFQRTSGSFSSRESNP
jgi:hypothetical protein